MKKSMFASVKPLAMATAVAAGTSMSMIAVALPGGDTSGAAGVVNETVCHNSVDMTIASGTRSVTTGTGTCQLRTLPPTKGLVLTESTPAGATVTDSSALVNAGGESYETYVGGNRQGSVLLTPNRSLAVTRSSSFVSGADGAVSFDIGAAVQPSTGLQSSWLTGTYNIVSRAHGFQIVASGLEQSVYAAPNPALGERNNTAEMTVSFNGDGTCDIDTLDNRGNFTLTKDPMMILGEMDNGCTVGGGNCGQNDGNNYVAMGNVNAGSTGSQVGYYDWLDANPDGKLGQPNPAGDCDYTVAGGVATVNYHTQHDNAGDVIDVNWTSQYNVSADLRYLVSSTPGNQGNEAGTTDPDKGDIAIGVRVGAGDVSGKTYLFNMTAATLSASTPTTGSYENPQSPLYSEEECISRGSIAFVADGTCSMQSVSSCAGRSKSGYEESADGAADGTVVDNLTAADGTDAAPTSCTWTNAGGLVVSVGTVDPDSNPITVTYTGDVSDNGEALVMQGEYSVEGAAPDVENAPLLPQQQFNIVNFMVAQEYQGSLTADADADGATNYDEFVWAADLTPAGGIIKNDYNGTGASDALFLTSAGGSMYTEGAVKAAATYPGTYPTAYTYQRSGDFNGDGKSDALFYNSSNGGTMIWPGMVKANATYPGTIGTGYVAAAVCDLNGDGSDDVLWRSGASNVVWSGAVKATASYPGTQGTSYALATCGDVDADGQSDLFWRDGTSGANEIWLGGVKANKLFPGAWSDLTFNIIGAGDMNGDGTDDVLWHKPTTGSTQIWNGGLKSTIAYPGSNSDVTWSPITIADYAGDGIADIYWRKSDTGGQAIWPNASKAGATYPGSIATSYVSQK